MKTFLSFTLRLIVVMVVFGASDAMAQLSTLGRDFYFACAPTSFNCLAIQPFQSYWIVITSPYDCNATISYFDPTSGNEMVDKTVHIKAKSGQQLPVNNSIYEHSG